MNYFQNKTKSLKIKIMHTTDYRKDYIVTWPDSDGISLTLEGFTIKELSKFTGINNIAKIKTMYNEYNSSVLLKNKRMILKIERVKRMTI